MESRRSGLSGTAKAMPLAISVPWSAQKEFLHGVLDAVRREGRLKSIQILLDHAGEVKTDLPLGQMASLANRAYQVPDSGVEFYLLPGRGLITTATRSMKRIRKPWRIFE